MENAYNLSGWEYLVLEVARDGSTLYDREPECNIAYIEELERKSEKQYIETGARYSPVPFTVKERPTVELKKLGELGWELVTIYKSKAYFKRPTIQ